MNIVLQTDDKGVFATQLSDEYKLLLNTFHLSQDNITDLAFKSIDYIFESDDAKDLVRQYFNQWKSSFTTPTT